MTLTDTAIKNAQTRPSKPCKLHDDNGMYVLIHPNGGKYFRLDYRHEGKRKKLVLGTYPKTTLKQKRQNSDEAKKQIDEGIDPSNIR